VSRLSLFFWYVMWKLSEVCCRVVEVLARILVSVLYFRRCYYCLSRESLVSAEVLLRGSPEVRVEVPVCLDCARWQETLVRFAATAAILSSLAEARRV